VATGTLAAGMRKIVAAAASVEASGATIPGSPLIVKIAARSTGFMTCFKKLAAAFCWNSKKPF
jgi:hypothetical protein